MKDKQSPYLIVAITSPISIVLLKGQLKYFNEHGYRVGLICHPDDQVEAFCEHENAKYLPVPMERDISILKDVKSLIRIYTLLKTERPDMVNAGTPKASLLVLTMARLLAIKVRIYTCRGFRFDSEKGIKRNVLKGVEKLVAFCSHRVICISPSVEKFGLRAGIFSPQKSIVIGKGSSNGINLEELKMVKGNPDIRKQYNIPHDAFVIGFVGRLVVRKGIEELVIAFSEIAQQIPSLYLLIVGTYEETQLPDQSTQDSILNEERIILTGWQTNVLPYYTAMDIFALPAYWEGFGNVLIQAAALGVPVVATNVTGCRDAVSHNYNGILIESKNVEALKNAILRYYHSEALKQEHSSNGKKWAQNFDSKIIWKGMSDIYSNLLKSKLK